MKIDLIYLRKLFISNAKLILVNFVILLVLFEISSRVYLSLRRETSLFDPSSVAQFYYPELKPYKQNPPTKKTHNILLLGASVLNPAWGSVEEEIKNALKKSMTEPFVVHNFGMPAHTSRDSLIKYNLLEGNRFDKIFVYHGINDIRMNNYSRARYKNDYSHIHWYRTVNPIFQHPELSYIATPFMIQHTWFKITTRDNDENFENKNYGDEIKTRESFLNNLKAISEIAKTRQEDLIFSTFSTHRPTNYSEVEFNAKKLDYDKHLLPVEVWGLPENVKRHIKVHNRIIRDVAKAQGIPCIDLSSLIPKTKVNFDDICHLTSQGSHFFAQAIIPELLP